MQRKYFAVIKRRRFWPFLLRRGSISNAVYGFSGFAKEVTPCSLAKTLIPRALLYSLLPRLSFTGMHDGSPYLGRNGCHADYEKLKITLKQKTISQISRGWDDILGTLTLDCGPSSFYSSMSTCLFPLFVTGIKLRSLAPFTWNNSKGETKGSLVVKLMVATEPTQIKTLTIAIRMWCFF